MSVKYAPEPFRSHVVNNDSAIKRMIGPTISGIGDIYKAVLIVYHQVIQKGGPIRCDLIWNRNRIDQLIRVQVPNDQLLRAVWRGGIDEVCW